MGKFSCSSAFALRTLMAIAILCGTHLSHVRAEAEKADDPFGEAAAGGDGQADNPFGEAPTGGDGQDECGSEDCERSAQPSAQWDAKRIREQHIKGMLEDETQFDYFDTPLEEVVADLSERLAIPIKLDRLALDELGFDSGTQITSSLRGISLKSALRLALHDLGLDCMIKDEVLLITTAEKAAEYVVTEMYDVSDLMVSTKSNVDSVVEIVTQAIAGDSWAEAGGNGSIQALGPILVVSQTHEVQEQIESLLKDLRFRCANPVGDWDAANQIPRETETTCKPKPDAGGTTF